VFGVTMTALTLFAANGLREVVDDYRFLWAWDELEVVEPTGDFDFDIDVVDA
jgi:hypothetical protein